MKNVSQSYHSYKIDSRKSSVRNSRAEPQQTPSVEKHAHPPRVVYFAIYSTLTRITKFRVSNLHIFKGGYPVTLLPPPRRLAPSLGLGTTWVRQLRSLAVVIIPPLPPNVTNSRAKPQKPRRWKSMLIHQGWFTLLYTQHLLESQSFEFLICIFSREAIPSHQSLRGHPSLTPNSLLNRRK